jgi:hypothetical protein
VLRLEVLAVRIGVRELRAGSAGGIAEDFVA